LAKVIDDGLYHYEEDLWHDDEEPEPWVSHQTEKKFQLKKRCLYFVYFTCIDVLWLKCVSLQNKIVKTVII
jgi:hypothetical protein